jgi:translation elongation factor EF-1beta
MNAARWLNHMAAFTEAQRAAWTPDGKQAALKSAAVYASAPVPGKLQPPPAAAARPATTTVKKATTSADDDDVDLFGDEDEVEVKPKMSRAEQAAALKQKRDEETEAAKQKALERLAKKEANQRTLCNLEISPWEADQDLTALHKKIKDTVVREGLKWSEGCKLVGVGYGVKKMVLTAVLSMNLSMDAIIEEMADEDEGTFKDEIQSFTMTSMSLL